jgi:hypothetical protein
LARNTRRSRPGGLTNLTRSTSRSKRRSARRGSARSLSARSQERWRAGFRPISGNYIGR